MNKPKHNLRWLAWLLAFFGGLVVFVMWRYVVTQDEMRGQEIRRETEQNLERHRRGLD